MNNFTIKKIYKTMRVIAMMNNQTNADYMTKIKLHKVKQ